MNYATSTSGKVPQAVKLIEGVESLSVSPLPSPRLQSSPHTPRGAPQLQETDFGEVMAGDNSSQLRPRKAIKYPR